MTHGLNHLSSVIRTALLLPPLVALHAAEKPNVLLICTDQQHAGMMRWPWGTRLRNGGRTLRPRRTTGG